MLFCSSFSKCIQKNPHVINFIEVLCFTVSCSVHVQSLFPIDLVIAKNIHSTLIEPTARTQQHSTQVQQKITYRAFWLLLIRAVFQQPLLLLSLSITAHSHYASSFDL